MTPKVIIFSQTFLHLSVLTNLNTSTQVLNLCKRSSNNRKLSYLPLRSRTYKAANLESFSVLHFPHQRRSKDRY